MLHLPLQALVHPQGLEANNQWDSDNKTSLRVSVVNSLQDLASINSNNSLNRPLHFLAVLNSNLSNSQLCLEVVPLLVSAKLNLQALEDSRQANLHSRIMLLKEVCSTSLQLNQPCLEVRLNNQLEGACSEDNSNSLNRM